MAVLLYPVVLLRSELAPMAVLPSGVGAVGDDGVVRLARAASPTAVLPVPIVLL
jgi:hypothetical protein